MAVNGFIVQALCSNKVTICFTILFFVTDYYNCLSLAKHLKSKLFYTKSGASIRAPMGHVSPT